jgi:hypothetical protein
LSDQIKEDVMGKSCGTYGERINAYGVLVKKPKERSHLQGKNLDKRIIKTEILMEYLERCGPAGRLFLARQ